MAQYYLDLKTAREFACTGLLQKIPETLSRLCSKRNISQLGQCHAIKPEASESVSLRLGANILTSSAAARSVCGKTEITY
jgi:hypothetical protein